MDVFDGLLFDLDGTLWDSVDAICISWNRALERLAPEYAGTVTRARLLPCMGMLLPDILHRLVPELDQERMKPILEEVLSEENAYVAAHGGVLYPGWSRPWRRSPPAVPSFSSATARTGILRPFSRPMDWGAILRTTKTLAARGCPRRTTSPWWRSGTA